MKKVIICVLALSMLAACGIKPGSVKPPEGAVNVYPSVYPNPKHDGDVGPRVVSQPADTTKVKE